MKHYFFSSEFLFNWFPPWLFFVVYWVQTEKIWIILWNVAPNFFCSLFLLNFKQLKAKNLYKNYLKFLKIDGDQSTVQFCAQHWSKMIPAGFTHLCIDSSVKYYLSPSPLIIISHKLVLVFPPEFLFFSERVYLRL